MSDVLVTYASKMGATREIAEVITEQLRDDGVDAEVCDAAERPDLSGYRAVIVGSALYLRQWRPDAMRFLRRNSDTLSRTRVWLFQSGPTDTDTYTAVPWSVHRCATRIGAAAPVVTFGGRLDAEHAVGALAHWMATGTDVRGDARDWDQIRAWAHSIGDELRRPSAANRKGARCELEQ